MRHVLVVSFLVFALPTLLLSQAVSSRHPYASDAPISEPRLLLEGIVSTPDDDLNATFTADGMTVYFSKNVPNRLGVLLESRCENGAWTKPVVLSFSGRYSDYDPALSVDGNLMYFCSNRPKPERSQTDFDIWVVERTATGWGEPRNLGSRSTQTGTSFTHPLLTTGR